MSYLNLLSVILPPVKCVFFLSVNIMVPLRRVHDFWCPIHDFLKDIRLIFIGTCLFDRRFAVPAKAYSTMIELSVSYLSYDSYSQESRIRGETSRGNNQKTQETERVKKENNFLVKVWLHLQTQQWVP